MTTHLPERITVDLGAEGEFLNDDDPTPDATSPEEVDDTPRRPTDPDLAVATAGLVRREAAAVRTGAAVLTAECLAWLNASLETSAHLRVDLLNHRYATWTARQNATVEQLKERAAELDKRAAQLDRQIGQLLADAQHDPADVGKQVNAWRTEVTGLRAEAAAWLDQAGQTAKSPYTGHREPDTDALEAYRRRTARRRWAATAALGLAIGWAELRGGITLAACTGAGATLTAWAKGRFPRWRRVLPDMPDLAYDPAGGHPATTTTGTTGTATTGTTGTAQVGQEERPGTTPPTTAGTAAPAGHNRPFPIREATTPEEATECMRRALLAEGVPVVGVDVAVCHPWGWEARVQVSEGTAADIAGKLANLETKFDVGDGDVIVQPNRKRTAEALLRVVTGDLFGAIKPAPYRAPHSVDIATAGRHGMSADGSDMVFSLAELMGEVIARSGGGKSTILRALLDWTTAAFNAVTVFLDPSGDGPGQFSDAVKLTATHPIHIEFILLSLYRIAAGRARIRRRLGMGDAWLCTAAHPAIVVFIDEFPKLTKRSKEIIAELMLVGRKEGVWLLFAAQGATRELLGSNIAQHPALKVIGACRSVDTTQALGGGAADLGYLPHRLRPKSGTELNHCAQTYIVGAPGLSEDPMLHKWHYIPDDEGGRRAAERLAAGLVDVDQTSIDAALKAPNPPGLKFADEEEEYLRYVPWHDLFDLIADPDDDPVPDPADLPPILRHLQAAFDAARWPDFLPTDQALDYLSTTGTEWRQWDDREPTDRRREGAKRIARELKQAGASALKTVRRPDLDRDNPPSGYLLNDLRDAIDTLQK